MRAINFTAFTDDPSQVEAIKTFMDSLKIKFGIWIIEGSGNAL